MKTMKDFKAEYRLVFSGDDWASAMEVWFEVAGQMHKRGLDIPSEWEYRPGGGTDPDSYWYEIFEDCPDDLLIAIGDMMFRLRFKGKDY